MSGDSGIGVGVGVGTGVSDVSGAGVVETEALADPAGSGSASGDAAGVAQPTTSIVEAVRLVTISSQGEGKGTGFTLGA